MNSKTQARIGVFDSGIGGLTVLHECIARMPAHSYLYVGDTARLPYGTKSAETVRQYSVKAAEYLLTQGVAAIVIACNTASTHALDAVKKAAGTIPVIGMINGTALMAARATKNNHIAVIGTKGTIESHAYSAVLQQINPQLKVSSIATQLLVALAEEGWHNTPIAEAALKEYLGKLFNDADAPDTLILGCTHFPLFVPVLKKMLGSHVALITSGEAASIELKALQLPQNENPEVLVQVTDLSPNTKAMAQHFFGNRLTRDIELIDITLTAGNKAQTTAL